jgi:hypothetical protein
MTAALALVACAAQKPGPLPALFPGAFVERDENWDFTVPSASLSAEAAPCEGAILEFINQSAEGARRRRWSSLRLQVRGRYVDNRRSEPQPWGRCLDAVRTPVWILQSVRDTKGELMPCIKIYAGHNTAGSLR